MTFDSALTYQLAKIVLKQRQNFKYLEIAAAMSGNNGQYVRQFDGDNSRLEMVMSKSFAVNEKIAQLGEIIK